MTAEEILFDAEVTMEKNVDYMVHEFSSVRTGKASPALVENVDVVAYGSAMKLKQLALITTPEPRLLVVQPFDAATVALAQAVADATDKDGLRSVAGGGDTVSALRHAGVIERLSYVSSAGGAFLEWLEGKTLPGVAALEG